MADNQFLKSYLEDFEDNDAKVSLKKMIDFVIERKQ